MVLHLIQRSPYQHSALADCLNLCTENDAILLMEDGVLAQQHPLLAKTQHKVYALADDLDARGIATTDDIQACSYEEFVSLSAQYSQVISWF